MSGLCPTISANVQSELGRIQTAVAEHEREKISQRTKSALAAAKARGVELGKYGKTVLAARNHGEAVKRAWDLRPILAELEALGISSTRGVAHALDERGVPTPTGKRWHQTSTVRVLRLARAA